MLLPSSVGHAFGVMPRRPAAALVVVDLRGPHLFPMYEPYSHLVYAARASDVRTVIIEGQLVLQDRVIQTIDETEVFQRVGVLASELGRHWGRDTDWRVAARQ